MADASLVGTEVDRVAFPVEAGKIAELATAIHDPSPRYRDPAAAAAEGLAGVPGPLTFPVVVGHHRDQRGAVRTLGLDIARIVVGEVEWRWHRPVVAGDRLEGRRTVTDVRRKEGGRGGAMTFVTMETVLRDASGEPVVTYVETLIETGAAS
ncbi:FAS1-like dehydratase domain-containing protein [Patulibacter sp. S7RM1-6]